MNKPFVSLLLCFILGILIGSYLSPPFPLAALLTIVFLILSGYNELRSWRKTRVYFVLTMIFFGIIMSQWQLERNVGNISELAGKEVVLVGTVDEAPDIRANGTNYTILVEKERTGKITREPIQGSILLSTRTISRPFAYGDQLEIRGIPEIPGEAGNPGEFSYKKYLQSKGIQLVMKSWQGTAVEKIGTGHINIFVDISIKCKQLIMSVLQKTLSARDAGLMDGILFGMTGGIDSQARNDFALTGVVHILSVSGYHVALLIGSCMGLGNLLGLGGRTKAVVTVGLVCFYVVMTGAVPPVIRAAVMGSILLWSGSSKRNYDWPSSLSLAGLVILLYNPYMLFNAGFQLSFLATWGIFYLRPSLMKLLGFWPKLGQAIAVTLAAQISVLPITLYYFSYISLVSIPANLVIVPLISLVMLLGGSAALIGLVFLPAASMINIATGQIIQLVLGIAHLMARLPYAVVTVGQPSIIDVAVFYLLLPFVIEGLTNFEFNLRLRWYWSLHKLKLVTAILVVGTTVLWVGILWPDGEQLEITFLNIGQGDAAFIQKSSGYNMIIDTGGTQNSGFSSYNPGEKILVPFLRRKGVSKIDILLLSHAHADHIQGADAILENLEVRSVLIDRQFEAYPEGASLIKSFREKGSEINYIAAGEKATLAANLVLEALSPIAQTAVDENNDSLVVRLGYGDFHLLFTGDAEEPVLERLAKKSDGLRADIVKVPHHGSKNGWVEEFYRRVNPQMALISVGPNYFGHPSREVLQGLTRLHIPVLRTDLNGAITISSDGSGYTVEKGK